MPSAPTPASVSPDFAETVAAAQIADTGRRSKWQGRLSSALATYHLARQAWAIIEKKRSASTYTVTVMEHDEVYHLVQRWVLDRMPADQQRSLLARTVSDRRGARLDPYAAIPDDGHSRPPARQIVLGFDGTRSQRITLDGHHVIVRVELEDSTDPSSSGGGGRYKPHKVVFEAPDLAARDAVIAFLQSIADSLGEERRTPRLISAGRWGEWRYLRDLPPRPLDTVALPGDLLDQLLADLRRFLASEDRYGHLGVPWHRGYLLYGPPGVGKTTTATTLAHTLGLDVYYLPLADVESDANLTRLVGEVPARCVLLLEDVDIFHAATARNDDQERATMAGLLNALDGMVTPHGLITIMTTNDRPALDDALVRPGRVDMEVPLTYLVPEQFGRLVEHLTGLPCQLWEDFDADLGAGAPWPALTAAQVVATVTEHMHDPEAARKACLGLLDAAADERQPS